MKTADLDILLQEGEGVMLEYKESVSSFFARELMALANTAIFYPNPEVRAQAGAKEASSTAQVGAKLALSRRQVEILRKSIINQTLVDLMTIAERSDRTKFRHQVLNPLIAAGYVEMTIPEKPRSSKQQYRTTAAGRTVLANAEKETPA